ncbi:hypothetical protein L6164_001667 [Bauhinia variegata]|uniref:Uncharacterized protein n=1 Tax=Bauhinia variegata TaxID=167791 RepID=A0ACB9QDH0_BAUVA|nr:hypothetical protein L6164_001667 [Bauhinia variegata]
MKKKKELALEAFSLPLKMAEAWFQQKFQGVTGSGAQAHLRLWPLFGKRSFHNAAYKCWEGKLEVGLLVWLSNKIRLHNCQNFQDQIGGCGDL